MSEGNLSNAVVRPRRSKWTVILLGSFVALAIFVAYAIVWSHLNYPYGPTHACSKGMSVELEGFAGDDKHWFPHGENTPEASLGLLYSNDMQRAIVMLGGKTIPQKVVKATLEQYGKISPTTCGWHYVEGLRDDDDPQIAIAWDKAVGLGHNGQKLKTGMHEVILLDGATIFIGKNGWPEFVANQKGLLAQTIASRDTNAPPIRWSDDEDLGPNRFNPK